MGALFRIRFGVIQNLQYLKPATKSFMKSYSKSHRLIRILLKLITLLVTDYRSHISPFINYENLRFGVIMGLFLCFLDFGFFHSYLLHNNLVNQMIKMITNLPFILDFR